VTFANADAGGNPLVARVHHLFKIGIRQNAWRDVGSERADFGTARYGRTNLQAQGQISDQKRELQTKTVFSLTEKAVYSRMHLLEYWVNSLDGITTRM